MRSVTERPGGKAEVMVGETSVLEAGGGADPQGYIIEELPGVE